MQKDNLCPFCIHSIPQRNSGIGLVDCPVRGYGNACQMQCDDYRENPRLAQLMSLAVDAIKEFEDASSGDASASIKAKAAARSCALQEAVAAMLDISYDKAADLLRMNGNYKERSKP